MFTLAIFIGIYSYLIFFLGLVGYLTQDKIIFPTIIWFFVLLSFEKRFLIASFDWVNSLQISWKALMQNKLFVVLSLLIALQAVVNLIGVFAPEFAFDALWYHLTLPKLYLLQHVVFHIPGGLLYYSDMPKLGEMLYTGALAFGNEITGKFVHYTFGILICIALYKIARTFFSSFISLIAVVVFYSNIVVAWESTTVYIDLIRTFFETMGLWGFINWYKTQKKKWLVLSALMMGCAITTKLLALGTLGIFLIGLIWLSWEKKESLPRIILNIFSYSSLALLVPLPWFIFSYLHTGNPVYPFFTHTYEVTPEPASFIGFFKEIWTLLTHADDPISPLYILIIPLLVIVWKKLKKEMKYLTVFSILALVVWYFTPRTGGGRFIMPYLPVFSLIVASLIDHIKNNTAKYGNAFYRLLLTLIILVSCITILYRSAAEIKYLPVLFGKESKGTFLTNHLNFSYGDFYDTDNYFATHITSHDRVLLYGFHNLYYVDFPFVDNSWIQKGETFTYVAVQNSTVPPRFKNWQLVYKNDKSLVQLYKPQKGMCHKLCVY